MDADEQAAQRVGMTLCNKWTLERLIGTGGMAAVYVANHKIGRREAIKILHTDVARDPELRARFEQEAHAVNRFKHAGAVDVRDIDVAEDGTPFLVMELLEGESLATLARKEGGIELGALLRWVDELLDVLAAAHAQGIIHRDIKPDNLFIQNDGRLKVLDFGIARVRAGVPIKMRTRVGATLGTATYMPPEQIKGAEIDARADLFAVGATMFRLIAKRRIHEAESEPEMLVKMASTPAPSLSSVAPDAPRDVGLVVDRALMFEREQRYPDALTMQRDVRALRDGQAPSYASARADAQPVTTPATPFAAPPAPAIAIAAPIDGLEVTDAAPARASSPTKAASPDALHAPAASAPEISSPATPEPETVEFVGKPAHPGAAAPPSSSLEMPLPQAMSRPPGAERTLRSELGAEALDAVVAPQGYSVPETRPPEPPRAGRAPGPRTQPSGIAPPSTRAPGESIPVVDAPPPPPRRRTLRGTDVSVLPLVVVGIVFATIGVSVTLWFMLRDAPADTMPATEHATSHPAHATASAHTGPLAPPQHAPGNVHVR